MPELIWYPERGYGVREPDHDFEYGESYFENFAAISDTPTGRALNRSRVEFIKQFWKSGLLDVGVGCGAFIRAWGIDNKTCLGFDVAEWPRNWLRDHGKLYDPEKHGPVSVATFWDSLEHMTMDVAEAWLSRVKKHVFISIPLFGGAEHALNSHHFKPNEHILYFTEPGLIKWMKTSGFSLLKRSRFEEDYGRKDIGSYAFYRS